MNRVSAHPSPFRGWFCLHVYLRRTRTDGRAGCVSETRDLDMSRMRSARELSGHQCREAGRLNSKEATLDRASPAPYDQSDIFELLRGGRYRTPGRSVDMAPAQYPERAAVQATPAQPCLLAIPPSLPQSSHHLPSLHPLAIAPAIGAYPASSSSVHNEHLDGMQVSRSQDHCRRLLTDPPSG